MVAKPGRCGRARRVGLVEIAALVVPVVVLVGMPRTALATPLCGRELVEVLIPVELGAAGVMVPVLALVAMLRTSVATLAVGMAAVEHDAGRAGRGAHPALGG